MLALRSKSAWSAAACVPLLALLALLALSASAGPAAAAAYDDAQCESHVYPLDGSTLKPVRERFFVSFYYEEGAPPCSSSRRRNLAHRPNASLAFVRARRALYNSLSGVENEPARELGDSEISATFSTRRTCRSGGNGNVASLPLFFAPSTSFDRPLSLRVTSLLSTSFSSLSQKKKKNLQVSTPSPVADLTWAGSDADADRFVFAVTEPTAGSVGGRLFWSDARGAEGSWQDITNRLPGAFDEPPSGAPSTMRGVVAAHWGGPLAPETVLVQGAGASHYVTKDAGRTFARAATPGGGATVGWWAELKAHPHNPAWILSKSRRPECHGRGPGGGPGGRWCAFDLFATRDHGAFFSSFFLFFF